MIFDDSLALSIETYQVQRHLCYSSRSCGPTGLNETTCPHTSLLRVDRTSLEPIVSQHPRLIPSLASLFAPWFVSSGWLPPRCCEHRSRLLSRQWNGNGHVQRLYTSQLRNESRPGFPGAWSIFVTSSGSMRNCMSKSARQPIQLSKGLGANKRLNPIPLTSHPHPGYVFASQVPPTSSLFSMSSKLRRPYFRMIWTARPRPLMPAPIMRTSVSYDMAKQLVATRIHSRVKWEESQDMVRRNNTRKRRWEHLYYAHSFANPFADPPIHSPELPDLHRWVLHPPFNLIMCGVWVPSNHFVSMFAGRRCDVVDIWASLPSRQEGSLPTSNGRPSDPAGTPHLAHACMLLVTIRNTRFWHPDLCSFQMLVRLLTKPMRCLWCSKFGVAHR